MTTSPAWRAVWTTGPDAGGSVDLAPGRWLVGRAPQAHVRCDDPSLEPFHAELVLWPHGEVQVAQLAGRMPVRHHDRTIRVGDSVLEVQPHEPDDEAPAAAAHERRVHRRPRPPAPPVPALPVLPRRDGDEPPDHVGSATLVSTAVAALTALAIALVIGQALMAVFALAAAAGTAATWAWGRLAARRRRRRARRRWDDEVGRVVAAFEARRTAAAEQRRATVPTIAAACRAAAAGGDALWQRRPHHGDAFDVTVGVGDLPWDPVPSADGSLAGTPLAGPPLVAPVLPSVPIGCSLGPGARVLVAGRGAAAVARAMVLQLATHVGPADWQLLVAATPDDPNPDDPNPDDPNPDDTVFLRLPAAASSAALHDDDLLERARRASASDDRHVVLVVRGAHQLAVRTSAVRRCLAARPDWALLVVDHDPAAAPPPGCTAVVVTTADGGGRLQVEPGGPHAPVEVRVAGIGVRAALEVAGRLAGWIDPELADDLRHLPATVDWCDLVIGLPIVDADTIATRWARAPRTPTVVLGTAVDGVVEIDLVRDGPHALVAGTTGAGKSELLRALVLGLAATQPPERLTFVLVDFKGGAAFDALAHLPHVVGTVTDLDAGLVDRVLRSLRAELAHREHVLRQHGVADVAHLDDPALLPRVVVMVDEFAALAAEHSDALHALVGIARRGRSLGVHLVLATQRPAGVVNDEIRANTNLRLALRLHDRSDAADVVGDEMPAGFRRDQPGRCALRLGPDELVVFQAAHVGDLAAAVAAVRDAARDRPVPRRPWVDPLPDRYVDDGAAAGVHGVLDDPDHQRRVPWTWTPGDGHLLVAGSSGSGVSTALVRAAAAVGAAHAVVAIDAVGDRAIEVLADHPRCASVVGLGDREGLRRVLLHAVDATPSAPVVLLVDGLGRLRRHLDEPALLADLDLLDRLVTAPPPGLTLVLGADGVSGLPVTVIGRCPNRWVLHLHDPHDATQLGVAPGVRTPAVPGRAFVVPVGLHGQLTATPPTVSRLAPVARLGRLAPVVDGGALPAGEHRDRSWWAPVGTGFHPLAPVVLEVPDGEHVLVVGPARSGRSSALVRLSIAFASSSPDARVLVVTPRRSPLAHLVGERPTVSLDATVRAVVDEADELLGRGVPVLLAVDDAELVTDGAGALAALVQARRPGLVVAAAGRSDALRGAYGHWTAAIRRSGIGLVSTAADELAGDLLGVVLPRHPPLAPRPGLMWATEAGAVRLVQVGLDRPVPSLGGARSCDVVAGATRIVAPR